jgi:hypothetical protein
MEDKKKVDGRPMRAKGEWGEARQGRCLYIFRISSMRIETRSKRNHENGAAPDLDACPGF